MEFFKRLDEIYKKLGFKKYMILIFVVGSFCLDLGLVLSIPVWYIYGSLYGRITAMIIFTALFLALTTSGGHLFCVS